MRIALVIERIEAWRGGAETSTLEFASQLADRQNDVHIITRSRAPAIPSLTVQTVHTASLLRAQSTAMFVRRAGALCRSGGYDLIHAITPCPTADIYQPRAGVMAETIRRNLVLRTSIVSRSLKLLAFQLGLRQRVLSHFEKGLLHRRPPPMVAAISRYVARQLQEHYHLPESAISVIFNGVQLDESPETTRRENAREIRNRFGIAPGNLLVLCVAHNFKLKGVSHLIEALALLARGGDRGIRLLVVGRDNPIRYKRLADRGGIGEQVIFPGPAQRTWPFFHAADLYAHPTYYDPCSRVVLEALAAGLPCITTRYNGAAEIMQDGVHGYVIDSPDDIAVLADRIHRLTRPQHRRECAAAAARLRDKLSMARHVDEMLALYERVLFEKSRKSTQ